MEFIVDFYKGLIENHQIIFKNFLNEIVLIHENNKKNKGKKTIGFEFLEDFNKKLFEDGEKYLLEKGFKQEDFNKVTEEQLYNEIFGVKIKEGYEHILFPIYLGNEENTNNDNLFIFRRSLLNLLVERGIIIISNFNVVRGLEDMIKEKDEFFKSKFKELKEILYKKYGKNIVDKQFKNAKGKEKYLELISFKLNDIKTLIEKFEQIDNKKITYKDFTLHYNGKLYPLKKDSKRERFVSKFFSSNNKSYSKKDLINYMEFDSGDFYNVKTRKEILDLYKAINRTAEKKLGIKDLFYLGKGEDEDKICIKI